MGLENPLVVGLLLVAFGCFGGWYVGVSPFYRGVILPPAVRGNTLDGLRGYLALAVFCHHAVVGYQYRSTGGWLRPQSDFFANLGPVPVAMFFMITGYLFWTRAIRGGARIRAGAFFRNRVRRLAPMYLASVGMVLGVVLVVTGGQLQRPVGEVMGGVGRLLALGAMTWPMDWNGQPLIPVNAGVVWSLRFEWAFYLALPVVARLATPRRFLVILLPAFAGLAVAGVAAGKAPATAVHVGNFLFGMVAAHVAEGGRVREWMRDGRGAGVAVGALILALWAPHRFSPLNTALAFPFFLACVAGNPFWGTLSAAGSRFLGTISYSIYLVHGIVLYVLLGLVDPVYPVSRWSGGPYWMLMLVAGLGTIGLSAVTYRWVEHPFLAPPGPRGCAPGGGTPVGGARGPGVA
jgi:peptidoglycan/LPS O-acetylase OafA/YrhL